jgi:hypothetical protein
MPRQLRSSKSCVHSEAARDEFYEQARILAATRTKPEQTGMPENRRPFSRTICH